MSESKSDALGQLGDVAILVLLQGLEPRYDAYKAPALTFELQKYMERDEGFEPPNNKVAACPLRPLG